MKIVLLQYFILFFKTADRIWLRFGIPPFRRLRRGNRLLVDPSEKGPERVVARSAVRVGRQGPQVSEHGDTSSPGKLLT
jgi:hypothetical protein